MHLCAGGAGFVKRAAAPKTIRIALDMPRVIKHPEIRRAEILDAAFAIFIERGYSNTSLNDIIAGAGYSKGMFYHHFTSKEALLEALFDRITVRIYADLEPIFSAHDVDPKTRLQQLLYQGGEARLEAAQGVGEVFRSMLRPESKDLYLRVQETWAARVRPMLTDIVSQGVRAGAFKADDPEGVADLILRLQISSLYLIQRGAFARTTKEREAAANVFARRLNMNAAVIARALELPDDTFAMGPPDFAKKLLAALNPLGRSKIGPLKTPSRGNH
jgi:AcrR family transcriptional regulator